MTTRPAPAAVAVCRLLKQQLEELRNATAGVQQGNESGNIIHSAVSSEAQEAMERQLEEAQRQVEEQTRAAQASPAARSPSPALWRPVA